MEILVTNDDGYASPGLHALVEELGEIGRVIAVAPKTDQSATGRATSGSVTLHEREVGYAVDGTPVDCVIVGRTALDMDPDLVVSGCNLGANVGSHTLGRSGTVSAAVESAFGGIPALAVSLYVPPDEWPPDHDDATYQVARKAVRFFVEQIEAADLFSECDYLNINVPLDSGPDTRMRLTTPATTYRVVATGEDDEVTIRDEKWEEISAGTDQYSIDTDVGAILNGDISISPLQVHQRPRRVPTLENLLEAFRPTTVV